MVRDQHGKKMSKSFGNVVDPLDWIERYGADATRFTLLRGANPGGDVPVADDWAQGSRNFCNKLWNATRFALMNGAHVRGDLPPAAELTTVDNWILSRLNRVVAEVDAQLEGFDFAKACETLYHFAWDEVCDWYVELAKVQLADERAQRTRRVLGEVLDTLLRLLHPVIPFVTEELWISLTGSETVVTAAWPGVASGRYDDVAEAEVESLQRLITEVRRFRNDQGLKPGQRVAAAIDFGESPLAGHEEGIRMLLRLNQPGPAFSATASLPVEDVTVRLDTAGAIDVAAERKRLEKDLAAARKEADQAARKLANEAFMAKAPEAVVAKNRNRLVQSEADIERLEAQLAALPSA
jgi:valyl-tRNA synthetase